MLARSLPQDAEALFNRIPCFKRPAPKTALELLASLLGQLYSSVARVLEKSASAASHDLVRIRGYTKREVHHFWAEGLAIRLEAFNGQMVEIPMVINPVLTWFRNEETEAEKEMGVTKFRLHAKYRLRKRTKSKPQRYKLVPLDSLHPKAGRKMIDALIQRRVLSGRCLLLSAG